MSNTCTLYRSWSIQEHTTLMYQCACLECFPVVIVFVACFCCCVSACVRVCVRARQPSVEVQSWRYALPEKNLLTPNFAIKFILLIILYHLEFVIIRAQYLRYGRQSTDNFIKSNRPAATNRDQCISKDVPAQTNCMHVLLLLLLMSLLLLFIPCLTNKMSFVGRLCIHYEKIIISKMVWQPNSFKCLFQICIF